MVKLAYMLTPGLAVSIAMRLDHSFCFYPYEFEKNENGGFRMVPGKIYDKQQRLLHEARQSYIIVSYSGHCEDESRVREEMFGEGFYSPEREDWYVSFIKDKFLILP